jgi:hypothetical protein
VFDVVEVDLPLVEYELDTTTIYVPNCSAWNSDEIYCARGGRLSLDCHLSKCIVTTQFKDSIFEYTLLAKAHPEKNTRIMFPICSKLIPPSSSGEDVSVYLHLKGIHEFHWECNKEQPHVPQFIGETLWKLEMDALIDQYPAISTRSQEHCLDLTYCPEHENLETFITLARDEFVHELNFHRVARDPWEEYCSLDSLKKHLYPQKDKELLLSVMFSTMEEFPSLDINYLLFILRQAGDGAVRYQKAQIESPHLTSDIETQDYREITNLYYLLSRSRYNDIKLEYEIYSDNIRLTHSNIYNEYFRTNSVESMRLRSDIESIILHPDFLMDLENSTIDLALSNYGETRAANILVEANSNSELIGELCFDYQYGFLIVSLTLYLRNGKTTTLSIVRDMQVLSTISQTLKF